MKIGDRVLWTQDMTTAWTIVGTSTAIDRIKGACRRLIIEHRSSECAPAQMADDIENFVIAPRDWEDAPPGPDAWNHLTHTLRNDDAYDDELLAWSLKMKEWERRHKQPLLARLKEGGK